MAHRLQENDKHEAIQMGWHGLTEVKEKITLQENWLREWDLVELPLNYENGDTSGFSMLGCSDNPEIRIGSPYNPNSFRPIWNAEFLELIEESISGTDHKISSVGSVRNRGRVFLSIELSGMEKFKAAGREFGAFLNFGNGHDKSSVLWVNTSNICTVCDNTFGANLYRVEEKIESGDDISIRVRHTKNAKMRFPEVAKLIDSAIGVQAEFQIELDKLSQQPTDAKTAQRFFTGFLNRDKSLEEIKKRSEEKKNPISTRSRNTVDRLVNLFVDGKGNDGNDWSDVFSAATDYYSHESSGGTDKFKQIVSSEFDNGAAWQRKNEIWSIVRNSDRREMTVEHGAKILEMA